MRVLLLHEMSGVHTELRKGLRALGVDAELATFGDHFKKFNTDIHLGSTDSGVGNAVGRLRHQFRNLETFRSFDVIQSITPNPFNKALTRFMEPLVLGLPKTRFVYLSAGSDTFYRRHIQELSVYPPHEWYERPRLHAQERRVLAYADAVIGGTWDYVYTMRRAGYRPDFIPFPVDLTKIQPLQIAQGKRIVVYHPLNRTAGNNFKGTEEIQQAFSILRPEFEGAVDFVEKGGMPFEEYTRFTATVDVIVDQAYAHTYGMSAVYGLARGQVVLSGNDPLSHELPMFGQSPVVGIKPDPQQIAETLRPLLRDRARLREIGGRSRAYAERFHDVRSVTAAYLDLYRRLVARPRGRSGPHA